MLFAGSPCFVRNIFTWPAGRRRFGDGRPGEMPARTYQNPVYAGDMPDPSVKRLGDYYYAFGTTGTGRLPDGRIFTMLRSRNLVDWEPLGGALVPPSDNPRYQYWAPEITENQGKYYLYYAMGGVEPERFVIRVGVSDKPQSPLCGQRGGFDGL